MADKTPTEVVDEAAFNEAILRAEIIAEEQTNPVRSALVSHLIELRNRLIVAVLTIIAGFALFFTFKEQIFAFIAQPLADAQGGQVNMIYTAVGEQFFTYLKLSFLGGLFVGFPIILWEIWRFVAPGLYKAERRILAPFFVATPLLFYAGGAFMYAFVMPIIIQFFFGFQTENITAMPAVKEYLAFFTKMLFAFGLAFELPVLMLILVRFGVVTIDAISKFRRYAIIVIFAAAALLTPPDPLSQMLLAVPLLVFYEISILLAKFVKPKL